MSEELGNSIGSFLVKHFKTITMCVVFAVGLYVQHQANMMKIAQLEVALEKVNQRLDMQYTKLDNVKLDKTVFEATMRQFSEMSSDIRSIRDRLDDLMDKR